MTTANTAPKPAQEPVKPVLFVMGMRTDWGLFMPALFRLVREEHAGIHLLETGAPLGTGNFTSTAVQNDLEPDKTPVAPGVVSPPADPHPLEVMPEGRQQTVEPRSAADPNLAWPDTVASTAQMSGFVSEMLEYFRAAGFRAAGEWKPDFDRALLGEYAHGIGASVIAIPKRTLIAGIMQNAYVGKLEEQGFRVELLEEVSGDELEALKQEATGGASNRDAAATTRNQDPATVGGNLDAPTAVGTGAPAAQGGRS